MKNRLIFINFSHVWLFSRLIHFLKKCFKIKLFYVQFPLSKKFQYKYRFYYSYISNKIKINSRLLPPICEMAIENLNKQKCVFLFLNINTYNYYSTSNPWLSYKSGHQRWDIKSPSEMAKMQKWDFRGKK